MWGYHMGLGNVTVGVVMPSVSDIFLSGGAPEVRMLPMHGGIRRTEYMLGIIRRVPNPRACVLGKCRVHCSTLVMPL